MPLTNTFSAIYGAALVALGVASQRPSTVANVNAHNAIRVDPSTTATPWLELSARNRGRTRRQRTVVGAHSNR